jgi:hypothetical protein
MGVFSVKSVVGGAKCLFQSLAMLLETFSYNFMLSFLIAGAETACVVPSTINKSVKIERAPTLVYLHFMITIYICSVSYYTIRSLLLQLKLIIKQSIVPFNS